MSQFTERYNKLNDEQRQAVDHIDGPLLVVAGPGTGKTELLSMRTANILQKTDTLPGNILCLTFTDSGANAMRQRLSNIIGPNAYKVAIQTFHSFGTDVINQYREYFYQGAEYEPADELSSYEILTSIFDELDYTSPLASKRNGEYTYLSDVKVVISELKKAGLTSDELLSIINANDVVLDTIEKDLSNIFINKITTSMASLLVPIAKKVAAVPLPALPPAITPLANELALSMAHAFDEAIELNKTTPITAWRNAWMEKNEDGVFVFKSRKRQAKLRAVAHIYFTYLNRMEQTGLYDYDDMILNVVHAIELHADLKANLQERYQYIMVDEFQDTNLAQLRILFDLTDSPTGDAPNIMAVGDDDQAIYSFQGADVNNIHRFREQYPEHASVVLTQNYRSSQTILDHAREVIVQSIGRLETSMNINKQLTSHTSYADTQATITQLPTKADEYVWLASSIVAAIKQGTPPEDIAVLARRHSELVALVPYLHEAGLQVNYERRDNVLDMPAVQALELLAEVTTALFVGEHDRADSRLPELLAHPMFNISPETIWRLSLTAWQGNTNWLETMLATPALKPLAEWLLERAKAVPHETLEVFIDALIGTPSDTATGYQSPFYTYYFGKTALTESPDIYISTLEALRTLRTKLREYQPGETPRITDFLEFIRMHRELNTGITNIRSRSTTLDNAINLMTAHTSKGLEFNTVYVINSVDSTWGERVRSRSRLISYPENLRISPNANTYDERLRLYFVAMTRAKQFLHLSYSQSDAMAKPTLAASFLTGTTLPTITEQPAHTIERLTAINLTAWHDTVSAQPTDTMKHLLAATLENYKLSSTHLNNFIDITRGGPTTFLLHNLLRFPQAKSANASYGTAIHAALQRAHNHLVVTGERRPVEDILGDFVHELERQRLNEADFAVFTKRGSDALAAFFAAHYYSSFNKTQKTELNFASQGVIIDDAKLTGSLDLVDIKGGKITVTDYKTGKPSRDWKGKTDFEKIKLHKYKQQLMFYQLLCQNSRDYAKYEFDRGVLQFVEPDATGKIQCLEERFTDDELVRFSKLITAIWQCIMTLDFPDISKFDQNYKGVLAFEDYLIDKYS